MLCELELHEYDALISAVPNSCGPQVLRSAPNVAAQHVGPGPLVPHH